MPTPLSRVSMDRIISEGKKQPCWVCGHNLGFHFNFEKVTVSRRTGGLRKGFFCLCPIDIAETVACECPGEDTEFN